VLFDFRGDGSTTMIKIFSKSERRGGAANTLVPEIGLKMTEKKTLDYTKADVWSLGVATMLSNNDNLTENKDMVSNGKELLIPTDNDIVTGTTAREPSQRWSCYDVYNRTLARLVAATITTPSLSAVAVSSSSSLFGT
jgi:hypothetical protein